MTRLRARAGRPPRAEVAIQAALPGVLRDLRDSSGLTRREAANRAGLSINTLAALEQGKTSDPGFFKVVRAAQAYGASIDELVRSVRNRADDITSFTGPDAPRKVNPMTHGVVSAGYEGRTIDGFVDALVSAGVTAVADVRLNAISRKAGFSKGRLREALHVVGIDYLHFRTLGNPKSNREPFWSGRLSEGRATYRDLLGGDEQVSALAELGALADEQVVAVLCFEGDHERCHRQVVIDELTHRIDVSVSHLPAES